MVLGADLSESDDVSRGPRATDQQSLHALSARAHGSQDVSLDPMFGRPDPFTRAALILSGLLLFIAALGRGAGAW